jgi:hypothetical protein
MARILRTSLSPITKMSAAAAAPDTRACRNCGEVGHIARACTAPKKADNRDCR